LEDIEGYEEHGDEHSDEHGDDEGDCSLLEDGDTTTPIVRRDKIRDALGLFT
jgi:hypothetical protein